MRRFWTIAGIATLVAVLGVAALGAVAIAQDGGDASSPFDFQGKFKERVAELLGVTVEKYDAAVEQAQQDVVDQAQAEGWLTEDQAQRMRERAEEDMGLRAFGFGGKGFMGPHGDFVGPRGGFMGHGEGSLMDLVAKELDITVQELFTQLQDGKSIAELLSEDQLASVKTGYLAQVEENLNQAVAASKITQKQADWMLEQAGERVTNMLENTWEGQHPGGFRGGRRPGRMWDFPDQTDA